MSGNDERPIYDPSKTYLKRTAGCKTDTTWAVPLEVGGVVYEAFLQVDGALMHSLKFCAFCNAGRRAEDQGRIKWRCGRCKNTLYCSSECQKKDWKGHKILCNIPCIQQTESACASAVLASGDWPEGDSLSGPYYPTSFVCCRPCSSDVLSAKQ
jgi:hypothetical protein